MNLLHIVLYAIAVLALLLLGMYLGYLLTRYTLFNKIMEPAIRKSFSTGWKAGVKQGRQDLLSEVEKMTVLDAPLNDEVILQFMREVADAQKGVEPPPLANVDWTEGEEE